MSSFWTHKNASGRDFLIAQNVRDSAIFLILLLLNFWPLSPAPATCVSLLRFRVHSFKHSNIVYNVGASGSHYLYAVHLNIFERLRCLLSLSISRSHALCVKGAHLTRSDICHWAQDLLSSTYSSMVLSVISPDSRPVISQIWLLQLLMRFFHRIGLLLNCCHGLIFPSGLKVWNIA